MSTIHSFAYLFVLLGHLALTNCEHVIITSNTPIVKGSTATFVATLYDDDGSLATDTYTYKWKDNGMPPHTRSADVSGGIDTWTVQYDADIYPQGPYEVQVEVIKNYLIVHFTVASYRLGFEITETLNGELQMMQKNETRKSRYISSKDPLKNSIILKATDAAYIKNATTVFTYWFIDCTYYGYTNNMSFVNNFPMAGKKHVIEALVVADFTPPPPTTTVAPTTSTTKATTTVKPNVTTSAAPTTTTTTPKPISTSTTTVIPPITIKPGNLTPSGGSTVIQRSKREANVTVSNNTAPLSNSTKLKMMVNGSVLPYDGRFGDFPFICNSSKIALDVNKTYGYFSRTVIVKDPIANVNVSGNNWLQHGDILSLSVRCQGSQDYKYCVRYVGGDYNVTHNETCPYWEELDTCYFLIQRYFIQPTGHTILIIIKNQVNKVVTPVKVTVYNVKKQAQLSVIVVPVSFSLAAVVLIVFGVAYYFQNRSRFIVEVADFNFGQPYNDLEYKTFRERLRDSIANAFTRAPSPTNSEAPVWPPGRKYGSMT